MVEKGGGETREKGVKCRIFLSVLAPKRSSFYRGESEIGKEKTFGFEKDFSAKKKGEIEERDEGVAKRLEPNWNST